MEPAAPLRVLGVDPGTLHLGFAVLEESRGAFRLLESGVIDAPAGASAAERLGRIQAALAEVIRRRLPGVVALESPFFGKNVQSMVRLGEARGCVLALAGSLGIEVFDYPPATVKKAVAGNGGATKEQLARVLSALLPELRFARTSTRLDETDAVALAWCHFQTRHRRATHAKIDALLAAASRRMPPGKSSPPAE